MGLFYLRGIYILKFRFFFLLFILIIKVETGFVKCIKETSGIVILILYICFSDNCWWTKILYISCNFPWNDGNNNYIIIISRMFAIYFFTFSKKGVGFLKIDNFTKLNLTLTQEVTSHEKVELLYYFLFVIAHNA